MLWMLIKIFKKSWLVSSNMTFVASRSVLYYWTKCSCTEGQKLVILTQIFKSMLGSLELKVHLAVDLLKESNH